MALSSKTKTIIGIAIVLVVIVSIVIAINVYPKLKNIDNDDDKKKEEDEINHAPIAKFKAIFKGIYPVVGEQIYFNASGSMDYENEPLTYQWDFNGDEDKDGDGNPENDNEKQGMNVSKVFNTNATFLIVLTVYDPSGLFDLHKENIRVELPNDEAPYVILTPAGKKGGITGTKYTMTVASVDFIRFSRNFTVEILDVEGENMTVIYNSPVANLTAGVTYTDIDLDGYLTTGDSFIITPNDDLPVPDGDFFILYYGRDQIPAGEMFFASIGF